MPPRKLFGLLLTASLIFSTLFADGDNEKLKQAIQRESQPKEVLTNFERDYVLLKKGQFEIENAFSYTYTSAKQIYLESFAILDPVFLTLGRFGIENNRRHIFTDNISLRYGIKDNFQIEIAVPLIYRYDRYSVIAGEGQAEPDKTQDQAGIGDVSVSLTYQPIKETDSRPALLVNLGYKFKNGKSPFDIETDQYGEPTELPLGSGYNSIKIGMNLVKSIDPVVVYGGVSYSYNKKISVNNTYYITNPDTNTTTQYGLVEVDPGDTISINVGLGYAISYNFSIGFQFIDDYTFATDVTTLEGGVQTNSEAPNSTINSAQFKFTAGWALSENSSLNFGLGVGLTADSPDFVFEVRYPIRF